ncbi:hypothetical protein LHJ74_03980 [Streptomyces sp. N2-109]|uniref:Uncharacterized protein n=1 Tax=Streptomyces gossypii TaxID=2883101 RepID=A0ABT2JMJ4_9ACTN|nr:hypothetical protein [Streptomyces gossypii]MCT2589102.1 hypothetical protein [Streptomyces gossypii]
MNLIAANMSGILEEVFVAITGRDPHELTLKRAGLPDEKHQAGDLFSCLMDLRRSLESEGLLLCCQGARLDVTSSGMLLQMTDGREAYTFDPSTRTVHEETVYILDPAPLSKVATVSQQRDAIFSLHGIRGHGLGSSAREDVGE